jgi:serine/threonine protein kinase
MQEYQPDLKEQSPELRVYESETKAPVLVPSSGKPDHLTEIGQYKLVELIAKGSSGDVWRAGDGTGVTVAIKMFRKELLSNADALQRFHQEAKMLVRVAHPNVVSILNFGETADGSPCIVMEFVEGQTIKSLLETEGVFQPKTAAKFAREMCRALIAAHEQTVIHRDLKPSNVIITKKNDAKLIDFGIAKAVGYTGETITQLGELVGTPAYMSPEQCLGKTVDARSDVYALGCTLFEMLTGEMAFASNSAVEAIAKQLTADRTSIRSRLRATNASSALQSIVLKCLEREPANRYATVQELEHDLSAFMVDAPLRYAGAEMRGKRFLVAAAALMGAVVACILVFKQPLPPVANSDNVSKIIPAGAGIDIRNCRTGARIFFDPSAANLKEALEDAARKKVSLFQADLAHADVDQANLQGLDLRSADLRRAKFHHCQLNQANLSGADLSMATCWNTQFQFADLSDANCRAASLIQCSFLYANCKNTNFADGKLTQAHFDYANLRGANLAKADLIQTNFRYAHCQYAKFDAATVSQTIFDHASLHNASFASSDPTQVRALHAELDGTGLSAPDGFLGH